MRIFVTTNFEGIHQYIDAPEEVNFLRNPHRHLFGVYVEMDVFNDDRELEFIMVKRFVKDQFTKLSYDNMSCEQIARRLLGILITEYGNRNYKIVIDEDKENGAILQEVS